MATERLARRVRPRRPDRWGVDRGYEDALGCWHDTPAETRAALRRAMDGDNDPSAVPPAVSVVRAQGGIAIPGPGELTLEDGATIRVGARLPRHVPAGYHTLLRDGASAPTRLIVVPRTCYLPADLHVWGWAVQLYAVHSGQSWGIGDLGDLRRLAVWARELGAGIVLVNPLHAVTPVPPIQASPYFPSSRRFRNPLYLRLAEVPGAESPELLAPLDQQARALNGVDPIDRTMVFRLKSEALERLWRRFAGSADFDRYRAEQGRPLDEFAAFCTLAEQHGANWHRWPSDYERPDSPAVTRLLASSERVRFHAWTQWLIDVQLARAGESLPVMQDLPIGIDPDGADAWSWQNVLARDVTVGAPPDEFNTQGQNWGLPPFVPEKLRAAGYEPFIQTIRASLRHAGGLRIDHVMGLFRLFWIPQGAGAAFGGYVRNRADDLLGIIALESHRAKAFIVGEDLGTVEAAARETLRAACVLSYRLLWFETARPAAYPKASLAAVTTHDLPTVAGLWTGSDLDAQRRLGLKPNEAATSEIRDRVMEWSGVSADADAAEVVEAAYRLLAAAPAAIVTATLEDAACVERRPNMPSTVTEWPNWSIPLPLDLESLERAPLARSIAAHLRRAR